MAAEVKKANPGKLHPKRKTAKRKGKKKVGRPALKYDPAEIEKLAALGCTYEEMGDWLGWGKSTVDRKISNEEAFREAYKKGRAKLKMSLRRMQLKAADRGSAAMLIFLGKIILKQRDTQVIEIGASGKEPEMNLDALSKEELLTLESIIDKLQKSNKQA